MGFLFLVSAFLDLPKQETVIFIDAKDLPETIEAIYWTRSFYTRL